MEAASFRRTLFLSRVPKGTERFLMRRLASLIYFEFQKKKSNFGNFDYVYKKKYKNLQYKIDIVRIIIKKYFYIICI
jgi:hypothetical protein